MKRVITLTILSAMLISVATYGQNAKILTDSGLIKLKVFVGTWKSQSSTDAAAKNKNGAVTTCKLSTNGNYLVCDQAITNGDKQSNNLSIYSYNSANHQYTLSLVGIPGMEPFSTPVMAEGDTLTYPGKYKNDKGETVYHRTLNTFFTTKYYTYTVQSSTDGIHWITLNEGASTKITD